MRPPAFRSVSSFVRREAGALTIMFAAALLVWFFLHIAEEMGEGETRGFDAAVLLALRTGDHHEPIGPAWLPLAATDVTALGGFTVLTLLTLFAGGYLLITRKYGDAAILVAAILGAAFMSEMLKLGFARPRPDLVAHAVETMGSSFPSGHATLSAAAYPTIGALLARTQQQKRVKAYLHGVALLLTFLIGASRVYLGVHWPTDVLAGWCLGAAWSIACVALAEALARDKTARAAPVGALR